MQFFLLHVESYFVFLGTDIEMLFVDASNT